MTNQNQNNMTTKPEHAAEQRVGEQPLLQNKEVYRALTIAAMDFYNNSKRFREESFGQLVTAILDASQPASAAEDKAAIRKAIHDVLDAVSLDTTHEQWWHEGKLRCGRIENEIIHRLAASATDRAATDSAAPETLTPQTDEERAETIEVHPDTRELVQRFSGALLRKLAAAEKKYGYSNHWKTQEWREECQQALLRHLAKGDPRDVAAYCAFLWYREWPTIGAQSVTADAGELLGKIACTPLTGDEFKCEHGNGWKGYLCPSHRAAISLLTAAKPASAPAAKLEEVAAKCVPMPDGLDFRNAGQQCDMITGPCACGAWHQLEDLPHRIFTQLQQVAPAADAESAQTVGAGFFIDRNDVRQLRAENKRLENLVAAGTHTCHDQCQRPICVMRRERDQLRAALDRCKEDTKRLDWLEQSALLNVSKGPRCWYAQGRAEEYASLREAIDAALQPDTAGAADSYGG